MSGKPSMDGNLEVHFDWLHLKEINTYCCQTELLSFIPQSKSSVKGLYYSMHTQ